MKVIVITASLSRLGGGLLGAVSELYKSLKSKVVVFGLKDNYLDDDAIHWGNLDVRSHNVSFLKSFGYSNDLRKDVMNSKFSLLHLHGIWMYPQWLALKWKNKFNKPVIISPHGMLDPWAVSNSAWKKKLVCKLFANKSLKTADCIHALCDSEYKAIRAYGIKSPIAIIPNGIKLPETFLKENKVGQKKTLLFIGRVHPKKGLELLIEALYKLKKKNSDFLKNWNIQIVGWDQGNHLNYLRNKCSAYNLQENITFIGPLFGEDKQLKLKSADAFILPSYSEGLPMSILEAWSYKLPVLMTNECNLPEGFATGSAIELKLDSEMIAIELEKMNNLNEIQLREIGVNGFELVKQEFTWDKIALDMEKTYNWLLTKKDKPNFVDIF